MCCRRRAPASTPAEFPKHRKETTTDEWTGSERERIRCAQSSDRDRHLGPERRQHPRFLLRLLPFVDVAGGVYRVNRRAVVLAKPGRIDLSLEDKGRTVRPGSLRAVPLFSRLGDAELATLADKFTQSRHKAGEVIAEEGSSGRSLVIVADGTVELTLSGPYKGRLRQGLATRGDYFGDDALVGEAGPAPAVKALSAVTLLTLDRAAIEDEAVRSRIDQYQEERDRLKGTPTPTASRASNSWRSMPASRACRPPSSITRSIRASITSPRSRRSSTPTPASPISIPTRSISCASRSASRSMP